MSFGGSTEGKKEKSVTKEATLQERSGTRVEQLQLEQAAIDKIVQDVLGGANGLKDIFGGEQTVGLFDSSVAAQASADAASIAAQSAQASESSVQSLVILAQEVLVQAQTAQALPVLLHQAERTSQARLTQVRLPFVPLPLSRCYCPCMGMRS